MNTTEEARTVVLKFGGTSIATPARLRRAAARISAQVQAGHRVVVVVSAAGSETDRLLSRIEAISAGREAAARETDRLLATGEDRSAALLALALCASGLPARSVRGGEAGIRAHGEFGAGVIDFIDVVPVRLLQAQGWIPVVSGFQGQRSDGETLTLGRGGSDITAVALAAALKAEVCHIVTDVSAVHDRDPRKHANAHPFTHMDHAELVALTEAGAEVVHPRAARLAAAHGLALRVYGYRAQRDDGGTWITAGGSASASAPALPQDERASLAVRERREVA